MAELFEEARGIWISGGWAMIALAVNAILVFTIGFNLWFKIKQKRGRRVSEKKWRKWLDDPRKRKGRLGELISSALSAPTLQEVAERFDDIEAGELASYDRDLKFMKRFISTAPLLGLLGTVTGMLATFYALAEGSGGQQTMDMIAAGISEALITTETGLIIALPGLFFQFRLSREKDMYATYLARLETACMQHFLKHHKGTEPSPEATP
jgi:biopolymer transport protein ExbB